RSAPEGDRARIPRGHAAGADSRAALALPRGPSAGDSSDAAARRDPGGFDAVARIDADQPRRAAARRRRAEPARVPRVDAKCPRRRDQGVRRTRPLVTYNVRLTTSNLTPT